MIGSFGSSAVLLYGAPRSPLAQPRNLVGGHFVSALVGVFCWQLFHDYPAFAQAIAVATAIGLMHLKRTLHPPGGATALIATLGSAEIQRLGFWYVLMPATLGPLILLLIALVVRRRSLTMRHALATLLLTVPLSCMALDTELSPLRDAIADYARRVAAPGAGRCDATESLALPVALSPDARPETRFDVATGRLHIFSHMEFNDLTEGWDWHPEAVAEGRDYYTYKYLALGSTDELRGSYPADDMTGMHKEYPVQWRYDYFFAFDNLYAFYSRNTDDATGFVAAAEVSAADAARLSGGDLRMALRADWVGDK